MANTYTQINIHAVFSVNGRENVLTENFSEKLFKYIAGILKNCNQYSLAVNGYLDHFHVFFELNPAMALSDIMRIVKTNSSKWINENNFVDGKFSWQLGYGAFTYSKSQRDTVLKYIMNQKNHHGNVTFKEEYLQLLKSFDISFNDQYIFEFYDDIKI